MDRSTHGEVNVPDLGAPQIAREIVRVVVTYLPAPDPFRQVFKDEVAIGVVRSDRKSVV